MPARAHRRARFLLGTAIVVLLVVGTVPASGIERGRVTRMGRCTDDSGWFLTVRSLDDDLLRVRLTIVGGPEGDEWNVFLDHNGEGFYSGSRISGESGLVVVRRRTEDLDGADTIRAGAHDTDTGETCAGRATLP